MVEAAQGVFDAVSFMGMSPAVVLSVSVTSLVRNCSGTMAVSPESFAAESAWEDFAAVLLPEAFGCSLAPPSAFPSSFLACSFSEEIGFTWHFSTNSGISCAMVVVAAVEAAPSVDDWVLHADTPTTSGIASAQNKPVAKRFMGTSVPIYDSPPESHH